jgi:hypothetical protein
MFFMLDFGFDFFIQFKIKFKKIFIYIVLIQIFNYITVTTFFAIKLNRLLWF